MAIYQLQAIYQQIEKQGWDITHKKSGSVAVEWLLKSLTPGVYISEIDASDFTSTFIKQLYQAHSQLFTKFARL